MASAGSTPLQCRIQLPFSWHLIKQVREDVAAMMPGWPDEERHSVVMAASELAENVIKYGEPLDGAEGTVSVTITNALIRVQSRNGVSLADRAARLQDQVQRIRSGDPEALYLDRLRLMIEDSTIEGGLGLLRIAFEGKFALSYAYEAGIATITAEKQRVSQ